MLEPNIHLGHILDAVNEQYLRLPLDDDGAQLFDVVQRTDSRGVVDEVD